MEIIVEPERSLWSQITARPEMDMQAIYKKVKAVMQEVKQDGDAALLRFTHQFDGVVLENLLVTKDEIEQAASEVSVALKEAIQQAAQNIEIFHGEELVAP